MIRLVAKTDGYFDDAKALARVPALVRRGTTYPVRVLTEGDRIQVFLNGTRIIDVTDTTYTSGHVGLNVFGEGGVPGHVRAGVTCVTCKNVMNGH